VHIPVSLGGPALTAIPTPRRNSNELQLQFQLKALDAEWLELELEFAAGIPYPASEHRGI